MDLGPYTLKRLRRDDGESSKYLDTVMSRIRETSKKFDGSGDGLAYSTWKLYAEGTPLLGLWVAVDSQDQVIGHALGDIEQWSGRTVAWISQVVMDGITPAALKHTAMDAFDRWVDEANEWSAKHNLQWKVTEILMMSPRMTDAWARHAGLEPYRTVYRRIVRS